MTVDATVLARIRKNAFLAGYGAGKAHLASAFSIVEVMASLYLDQTMSYDFANPTWSGRDVLILSKGHGSLALYATLVEAGVLTEDELFGFCHPGSKLGGEPVIGVPGVEATTGSLGHGLSLGVGEALAFKLDGRSNRVFVVVGDGECQEGSIWEAAISAARYNLDNLIVVLDSNKVQKMGPVAEIGGISDWPPLWKSLGWSVCEVDGHDVNAISAILKSDDAWGVSAPRVLVANTVKGKGVSLMEGSSAWHWRLPKKRELPTFISELDVTEEEVAACKKRI